MADIISGNKGNDCILAGDGNDIIFGNEGNDNISGQIGNDIIKGQSGDDFVFGGLGFDIIDGGDGDPSKKGNMEDYTSLYPFNKLRIIKTFFYDKSSLAMLIFLSNLA